MITVAMNHWIWTLTIFLLLVLIFKWRKSQLKDIPGLHEVFFLGHARILTVMSPIPENHILVYVQNVLSGLAHLYQKEGIYRARLPTRYFVVLTSPKMAEVMTSSVKELNKGDVYDTGKVLADGLITLDGGPKWKHHRKIINQGFSVRNLNYSFLPIMNEHSLKMAQNLKTSFNCEYVNIGEILDITTFDIIMESATGKRTKCQDDRNMEYQKAMKSFGEIWVERQSNPWLMNSTIFKFTETGRILKKACGKMRDIAQNVIDEKRGFYESASESEKAEFFNGSRKHGSFLDFLLAEKYFHKQSLDEEDLLSEVATFISAGYDTTSVTTAWTIYLIGLSPKVQDKINNELYYIFGDDTTRPITPEDMAKMKYLDCVIYESMRLYPAVPLINRELQEDTYIDGRLIYKGTSVLTYIYAVHRHPDYYPDPEVFDPDRYFPEKCLLPFSAGYRNCIGQKFAMMEVRVLVANLLRNVTVTSLDQRDKIIYVPMVTGKPHKPLRVNVKSKCKI